MSKSKLRKDKTCLNCRHVVEHHFCPNCGQENSDTRKTFHHLFIHFFEDLTHYENAFWKTIKNLILRPGALTKEYLSGKRLSYLAPVRLYIFISFITFLLIALLPSDKEEEVIHINNKSADKTEKPTTAKQSLDSIAFRKKKIDTLIKSGLFSIEEQEDIKKIVNSKEKEEKLELGLGYDSMDTLENHYKKHIIGDTEYWFLKKVTYVQQNNTKKEIIEKFKESFNHNFPKVLFIYMPLFAFFLWVFHNKKRWYYFDHGIFTLHYFSFLLLMYLIILLVSRLSYSFGHNGFTTTITTIFDVIGYIWGFYYFFPAHHRFYGESRIVSFIKSIILFFINSFFILLILTLFAIYTFLTLH